MHDEDEPTSFDEDETRRMERVLEDILGEFGEDDRELTGLLAGVGRVDAGDGEAADGTAATENADAEAPDSTAD
jgi:hypothetical protein